MKLNILPCNDNNNGWLRILPDLPPAHVLSGEQTFDYVVVGAGFTGLAAARRLAELKTDARIALIDGGRIGNNAAGRCSGFAIDHAHNIRTKNFAGEIAREKQQILLNRFGLDALRQVVMKNQIDCDWREQGKIHAAATRHGKDLLRQFAHVLNMLGEAHEFYDAEKMKRITGLSFYREGLFTPGAVQMQPAALVRELAKTQPENVAIFEDSVISEVCFGQPHTLIGEHGRINAKTLVLANNSFGTTFGYYQKHIIPLTTYASMTRVLDAKEIASLGGENSWGIVPAHPFGSSVRRLRENRILIRSIYAYTPGHNPTEPQRLSARKQHEKSFRNRFSMLGDVQFEYSWGGTLCLSGNGSPIFGQLRPGVFASLCHNGVGVARGTACGKLIAEEIAGKESEPLKIMRSAARPNKTLPAWLLRIGAPINLAQRRRAASLEL